MEKKDKLDKELAKLNEEFLKLKVEHAAEETKLKTKKQTSQNMLEENIKTYDATMEEKTHEKQEIVVGLFFHLSLTIHLFPSSLLLLHLSE